MLFWLIVYITLITVREFDIAASIRLFCRIAIATVRNIDTANLPLHCGALIVLGVIV
ncbi:hypothetical protein [Methylobacterium sp. P1-11]|uniref:hypothetical protein n=1 Tax=Methylobacterium sp. P1-11 TaxID=2024616 RepID=UPI00156592CA|nr:hypothetical protein [Methylobacterium sp. P1-11]